jgi:tetratricopeptide (TPR) repeat protein
MKLVVVIAFFSISIPFSAAAQTAGRGQRPAQTNTSANDNVAEAYTQFLLGHHLEDQEDFNGAIAAYKRAAQLDPAAAEIPAELAALYLRQNKIQEAMTTAEQALKIAPANAEANRVLGIVYAALTETGRDSNRRSRPGDTPEENLSKAIEHLERAIAHPHGGEADPNVRATLSRLYIQKSSYDKAIALLTDLVKQEPGWGDGPLLLAQAYAGAGRTGDAIQWLENQQDPRLLPTLADFYERERRWKEAADAYSRAVQRSPRNAELRTRYASALLKIGGRDNFLKARDVLNDVVSSARNNDASVRALYLLSQTQRSLGEYATAEATARRLIAQNGKNPWGYYALAEALEERHQYQAVVDELSRVIAENRGKSGDQEFDVGLLLPHLGFAYQELGQHDKAIATFEEARRLSPNDPAVASYLVDANIAAKKYSTAVEIAQAALADHPDDLRLMRLHAQALRRSGKVEQGIAVLEGALKTHDSDPMAYISLAQIYSEADRGAQAVKLLQDAQAKFPSNTNILFELGAVYDKQKKFSEAEAAFKQVIAKDPENAAALNYLGYMLAERGERLDESVSLLKKALQIEPENGSYLDSLGWAYFKSEKLELAQDNLKRAAEQMRTNSVIQDHYGEVLFKLGRFDEAIAAWTRALAGDGDSINRADIDKKIRAARQKLGKK